MNKLLVAVALMLPLAGCAAPAKSLHPLISGEQATSLPGLSGTWVDDEDRAKGDNAAPYTFEEQKNHEYKLTVSDPATQDAYVLTARAANLNGQWFVDVILDEATIHGEKLDADCFWVPIHYFGRIDVQQDEIHAWLLGEDWLKAALADGRTSLRHEKLEEELILTAPMKDLQDLAIQRGWDEEVFSYKMDLWRRPAAKQ